MTDLAPFAEEAFDIKSWINASCAARGPDEPLERFLAELEMRLQLGAEEIEASLTECSSAALRRIPFAQQESSRLREDVSALQSTTKALLVSVSSEAEAAAAAAAPLAALHTARTNMEAGCSTLREASELSGAFRRVEEVFAAGDLTRVADMLRSMANSLSLVGDVPEFREGRVKLSALEDRLQRRVEGRLAEALKANDSHDVSSLAALLLAVGRYTSLESAYINSRMPLITAIWDEAAAVLTGTAAAAAGTSGLSGGWLLLLYNNLLSLLESDATWLGGCLPAQRQQLLLAAAAAAFEKLNKQIAAKLAGLHNVRALAGLLGDVLVAVRRLREVLAAAAAAGGGGGVDDNGSSVKLLKLLLEPIEQQVTRYSSLEESTINTELSAPLPINTSPIKQPPQQPTTAAAAAAAAEPEDLESDIAQKLSTSCSSAVTCLFSVIERCVSLTGGTELPQLIKHLDKHLAGYLQRLQAAVGIVNYRYTRLAAARSPAADITVILQLVTLARHVNNRLNGLETHLRSTLAQTLPRLRQLAAAGLPPLGLTQAMSSSSTAAAGVGPHGVPAAAATAAAELVPVRLLAFPAKLGPVVKLQEALGSTRFMAQPNANAAGNALCESITTSVYEALLSPVTSALAALPSLTDWTAAAGAAAAAGGVMPGIGAVVPTFSAYPLPAVTAVGEYLMGLPQQLEVLMTDEQQQQQGVAASSSVRDDDEGDELAAEWLDKVVRGAGDLYVDTILQISSLTPSGSSQLAADAEYFSNVMSALAVAPPAALITMQLFAAAPADAFGDMANGALAAGSADGKVLKALAAMRGISWTPEAATAATAAGTDMSLHPQDNAQQQQQQQIGRTA